MPGVRPLWVMTMKNSLSARGLGCKSESSIDDATAFGFV